jgi:cellobiose-specific phosphotransferase system component IIC
MPLLSQSLSSLYPYWALIGHGTVVHPFQGRIYTTLPLGHAAWLVNMVTHMCSINLYHYLTTHFRWTMITLISPFLHRFGMHGTTYSTSATSLTSRTASLSRAEVSTGTIYKMELYLLRTLLSPVKGGML